MLPTEDPPTNGSSAPRGATSIGGELDTGLASGAREVEEDRPSRLRVLVIDDSEADVELLGHEFLRGGFLADLTRVDDAAALKLALEEHEWDLILCDWVMPRLTALEALDVVQAHTAHLPVIILSGRIDEEAAVIALKRGAHDFIPKQNQTRLIPAVHRELHEARERERRHAAEVALRESEHQFRELAENISEVFWITNLSGTEMIYINPAYERVWGRSRERLKEHPTEWIEAIHPDDRERITEAFRETADKRRYNLEFRLIMPDGSIRWVWNRSVAILDAEGRPYRVAGVVEDVTERHAAESALRRFNEELERRVRARTDMLEKTVSDLDSFTQSVSHDLRAPLRAIRGFSTILLEDYQAALDERGRDYLVRACKGAEHMENLVEGLLKLSRLTKGEIYLEEIHLSAEATAIAAELETLHPERKVTCRVQSGVLARADRTLIRDAIRNLLSNAWKFTARTEHAEIEFGSKVVSGERVYWVADNGIGFDPTQAKNLFTMYRRLPSSKGFQGDGIGLAVVDRIITRHGGRVWAEGQPGRGATIFFTLGEENREPSTETKHCDPNDEANRPSPRDSKPAS